MAFLHVLLSLGPFTFAFKAALEFVNRNNFFGSPGHFREADFHVHLDIRSFFPLRSGFASSSPKILEELRRVLRYPRILNRLTAEQVTGLLDKLGTEAELVVGTLKLDILTRDPSDNIYLACAV